MIIKTIQNQIYKELNEEKIKESSQK